MKPGVHLIIATALLLVSGIAALAALLGPSASFATTAGELRVLGSAADPRAIPAERALQSIMPEYEGGPTENPFSPRRHASQAPSRIPPPPPPRVDPPALPILPVAERSP